jgi:glutathione synthase/RimK-type ligase-like ATP-grasp enzyme
MLIKALNLQYGAIDLIRCPSGEYVFLEINGNGQFLWAEEQSGVKVSDALARLLSGVTNPC